MNGLPFFEDIKLFRVIRLVFDLILNSFEWICKFKTLKIPVPMTIKPLISRCETFFCISFLPENNICFLEVYHTIFANEHDTKIFSVEWEGLKEPVKVMLQHALRSVWESQNPQCDFVVMLNEKISLRRCFELVLISISMISGGQVAYGNFFYLEH